MKKLPQRTEGFVVGNQLAKAGISIGAMLKRQLVLLLKKILLMSIGLKESRRVHHWLRLCKDSKLLQSEDVETVLADTEEVMLILGSIVKSSGSK